MPTGQPSVRTVRTAVLAALVFAAPAAGCGGRAADDAVPTGQLRTAEPPTAQRLAFAGHRRVGVMDGDQMKILGRSAAGEEHADVQWSADGRQLGWLTRDAEYRYTLRMFDVVSGRSHRWRVSGRSLGPSLTGLTLAGVEDMFVEYLPDGSSVERRVDIPLGERERRLSREHDMKWMTAVHLAVPRDGRWLVAAQLTGLNTELGPNMRLYDYDPATAKATPSSSRTYSTPQWGMSAATEGGSPAWAVSPLSMIEGAGNCEIESDFVERSDGPLPKLPDAGAWRWRIRQVSAAGDALDVVAARSRPGAEYVCEADPEGPVWLRWEDDRWTIVEDNIVSVSVAADGRRAVVEGRGGGLHQPGLSAPAEPTRAFVSDGDRELDLPAGTRTVRFSPRGKTSLRVLSGDGPAVSVGSRLSEEGLGPWRFGMTAGEMQQATATGLLFDMDDGGCGTVRVEDVASDRRLGVIGHLVDGRLRRISVTSRDVPPVEPDSTGTDLQPGVQQVKPRGPRLLDAVRAGDGAQGLFAVFGRPSAVRPSGGLGAAEHVYRASDGTLVQARIDAAGQIRRLEIGDEDNC